MYTFVCVFSPKKKKSSLGLGGDGSLDKELVCKHKDLSLVSRTHVKISGCDDMDL